MASIPYLILRPASLVALTAVLLLLPAGCHKTSDPVWPGPEPFTAQLTEIDGVQAIISLKHPKLVNQDLEKLMAGVPETAMLRMGLSQLAAYGYPEFSEIAAGSNVGVAILSVTAADLKAKSAVAIGFAKLKEGGKLGSLLGMMQLATQKQGDWVLFAKTPEILAKLKSPDAVVAYLEKPQTVDLRLWGRASPELLAGLKESLDPGLKAKIAGFSADRQKAALAYFDAAYSMLSQVHSVEFSLAFTDSALEIAESAQFLPDSPFGTYMRYRAVPPPAVARFMSADALGTLVVRQNPKAASDLIDAVFKILIAVDDPPISAQLKAVQSAYAAMGAASDGGGAAAFSLGFASKEGRMQPEPEFFYALAGRYTPEMVRAYMKSNQALIQQFVPNGPAPGSAPGMGAVETGASYTESALTVDGAVFDSWAFSATMNGKELSRQTEYLGIVDGNLVVASSEAALKRRLPALIAKTPLADGIHFPDAAGELGRGAWNGGPLVDLLAGAAKLDLTDDDTKAQINNLKADYLAAGPVSAALTAGQAKGEIVVSIPYKFIATSVHLGQYMSARKINLLSLLTGAATPGARPPLPASGGP